MPPQPFMPQPFMPLPLTWEIGKHRKLFRQLGAPLFLERDNGAVIKTEAVAQMITKAGVLALDSPAFHPRYNGMMKKQVGDFKLFSSYPSPDMPAVPDRLVQFLLEALRHEFNARPPAGAGGLFVRRRFYSGPRLNIDRPTQSAIFHWIWNESWSMVSSMKILDQCSFATAWRRATPSWLSCQALITIFSTVTTEIQKPTMAAFFSKKCSHYLKIATSPKKGRCLNSCASGVILVTSR